MAPLSDTCFPTRSIHISSSSVSVTGAKAEVVDDLMVSQIQPMMLVAGAS